MEPTRAGATSKPGMDDIEREAIRDEAYDPDDPAVLAALDRCAPRSGTGSIPVSRTSINAGQSMFLGRLAAR